MTQKSGNDRAYKKGYKDGRDGGGDQARYCDGLLEVMTLGATREPNQEKKRGIYKSGLRQGRSDRKKYGKR